MEPFFERITDFVVKMNQSNKILEKKKILLDFKDLSQLLCYVYSKNKVFYVTSRNYKKFQKNEKKQKNKPPNTYNNILLLLDDLESRKISGDLALLHLHFFIEPYRKYQNLILNIVDKNLKIRIGTKIINQVFPNCIETFDVALANKYKPKLMEKHKDSCWYISRKLDGIRCLIHVNVKNQSVCCYSRTGKKINTLTILEQSIKKNFHLFDANYFLDGELVSMKEDVENFKSLMEKIKRKNYTIQNPSYYMFDMIEEADFFKNVSTKNYSARLSHMKKTVGQHIKHITLLPQHVYSKNKFHEMIEQAAAKNWEGLMLRRDTIYEGKRTNNLLKYKKMKDAEFRVTDIIVGPFRYINENKLEDELTTLTAIKIDYNNTKVGSGFTIQERRQFCKNPELIIGKIVKIQFFEKTKSSLRFPVYKGLHGDKRIF